MTIRQQTHNHSQGKLNTNTAFMLCPRCGDVMYEPFVALSRIHPKVKVCPDCGTQELDGKDWQPVCFEWSEMHERYERDIAMMEDDLQAYRADMESRDLRIKQLQLDAKRREETAVKNREVLRQFQERIEYMDEQIKDLLSNLFCPPGQAPDRASKDPF